MSDLLNSASLVMIPSGYKEDTVYSVVPSDGSGDLSFTRASNGTRVNSAGLVEVVAWNLVQYSEDFSNGVWTTTSTTITADNTTAPNGTATADKVEISSSTNAIVQQIINSNLITGGLPCTFSVYIKSVSGTGNVGIRSGQTGLSSVFSYTNQWQRFEWTFNAYALSEIMQFCNNTLVGGADSAPSFYAWGAQLNIGSTAKPYFPTTDRLNVPRLTYQNGGGGCPSLLLEKQSTNLVTYSEQFDNADWTKSEVTISANSTTSPDGTQNADAAIESTTANSYHRVLPTNPFSGTGGAYYSFTTYVKKKGTTRHIYWMCQNSNDAIFAHFDMTNFTVNQVSSNGNGSNASASIIAVGNDWYRITLSGIVSTVSTNYYNQFYFENSVNTGFNPSPYTGDGVSGFYLWGWQIEQSSYPTSYIPTTSSSATRVKDLAYKSGATALIGQTEGVLFCDFNLPSVETSGDYPFIVNIWGNSTNRFGFARYPNGGVHIYMIASTSQFTYNTTQLTGRFKLALGYKANDCVIYLNGTLLQTITSATIPATDDIIFNGINTSGDYNTQLQINQTVLFKTRLTHAELASLTTI